MTTADVEKYIIPGVYALGFIVVNHSFDGETGFGKVFFAKRRDILEPDYEFTYSSGGFALFYNKVVNTNRKTLSIKRERIPLLNGLF